MLNVLYEAYELEISSIGSSEGVFEASATVPPKAPSPFVDEPTPRCICTLPSSEPYEFMLAQNTHWSSGELRGTPSSVTLMRESPAPRIRMYEVPVPTPFSLHASTPGVCEKRKGNSRPVLANACNS